MTSRRRALADTASLAAVAAVTGWCATTAWRGFTEAPGGYLSPLLLLAGLVAAVGVGLRQLRIPGALVLVAQVLVGGLVATSLVAGTFVATGEGWLRLGRALSGAVESAQRYPAPVPDDAPDIAPLLILGGWACLVLVDVCIGGLRRVSLAGLPLLTIYSIPVSLLGGGVPWWSFALTATGFLTMLFLQHREQTSRWGRGLTSTAVGSHVIRMSAASLGAVTVLLALLVPQFVPTMSFGVFGFGPGEGGGGDITVANPMVDLRRDLLRGEDRPLVRIRTDNPDPAYLRIAALNRYSDQEWSTGDREIPSEQRAQGPIANPDLDPSIPRVRYQSEVSSMIGFVSPWLPTAYPIERIFAPGDWRYDVATLDFLAADDDLDTAGLSYQMTELVLDHDAELLADAPSWSGRVSRDFIELPDDFPSSVRTLAQEVTRDVPSRYEKAVALQDWFRTDGGFEYSLDNVDPGNGTDDLVAFLTEGEGGRVGYCEQFAASMAVMARSLGIPARVAVGFLEPDLVGPQTFEYSSDDLHAWPELYFAGAGWLRFEPTPGERAGTVPAYTEQDLPVAEPSNGPSRSQATADPAQSLNPDPRLDPGMVPQTGPDEPGGGVPWRPLLGGLAALVLAAALALAPRLVRRSRRRARLTGAVEPGWVEIRATAIDLGIRWPEHRSPRETRHLLAPYLGAPASPGAPERPARGSHVAPKAAAALDRLVLDLEHQRYARPDDRRPGATDPRVVDDVATVVASLRGGATARTLRRATWWPASVLPWRRRRGTRTGPPLLAGHGGVVDHVG